MKDDLLYWLYSEIIEQIYEEYKNGMTISEIAEDWEISEELIMFVILQKEKNINKN